MTLQVCKSRFSASGIRGVIRVVRSRVKVFIRIEFEGLNVHAGNLIVVQGSKVDIMVLRSITIQSYTQCSARLVTCEFPPESYFQVLSYKRVRSYVYPDSIYASKTTIPKKIKLYGFGIV